MKEDEQQQEELVESESAPEACCDIGNGEVYIFGEITASMSKGVVFGLFRMIEEGVPHIVVYISSEGGYTIHSTSICEVLMLARHKGIEITTYAMGGCASGAADIFLCGSTRLISKYCTFLMHSSCVTAANASITTILKDAKMELSREKDFISDVLKDTGIDYAYYAEKTDGKDWLLTPKNCVKLGLAHRVTNNKPKEVRNVRGRKKTKKSTGRRATAR